MKKRISYTNQPSLFDKIIAGYVPEQEEKPMQLNINDYDKSETNKTKSLRNLNDIFFSKEFDYQDYKQSLKYNNKNLKKIGFENIKDPHPKLIKRLVKIDLSGLIELKFKDIQIRDDKFEIFDKFGGIQGYCKNLKHLQLSCPHLTTVGFKHIFKGPQNLITLDLSHSQIDDMGIQYLCGFKWNNLDQFILQWCKRLKNLSDMAVYSENFPQLRVIDIRFSYAENSTVSSMLNSSLVYTLSQIRVYGTAVKLIESKWNSQYIISQLQQKLQTLKLQQLHLKNDSVAVDSSNDKMQVRTNVIVNIDTEEKAYMTYSWKITNKEANISIREGPEQPEDRSDQFGQLFLFLQKEWQLRESLKKFSIQLNEVICKDNNVNAILNTVGEYGELQSVNINMKNQKILKPVTYYYLFQQMAKLKEIQYLSIDLQNCNIEVNNVFLKKILTSIQVLPYLYKFYLNLFDCKYMYLDDLKLFAYQTINSMKNPYLNKTHLMLTCNESLAYSLEDIANLYTSDYKKTINLNNEMMRTFRGNHSNTENRKKNIFYHQELPSQTSNDDFAKKLYKKLYIKYMIHDDSYIFLQDLGSGGFGKVVKALNYQQEEVAVKIIQKKEFKTRDLNKFMMEAQILSKMKHPNIVQFKSVRETDQKILIEMQLVRNGQLKDYLTKLTDNQQRQIMTSIFQAVEFIHQHGVVHRDLKPENILIDDPQNLSSLKIIDFGLSATYNSGSLLSGQCGTLIYMAPELFTSRIYSKPVDIWSCGILLYMVCSQGKHPIYKNKDTVEQYKEKLLNLNWEFPADFPPLAKNLFLKCVDMDPTHRYTAGQVLQHPWITGRYEDPIPMTIPEMYKSFTVRENFLSLIKGLTFIQKLRNVRMVDQNYIEKCNNISRERELTKPVMQQSFFDKEYMKEIMAEHKSNQIQEPLEQTKPKYEQLLKRIREAHNSLGQLGTDDSQKSSSIKLSEQSQQSQRKISSMCDIELVSQQRDTKQIVIKIKDKPKKLKKVAIASSAKKPPIIIPVDLHHLRSKSITTNNQNIQGQGQLGFESPKKKMQIQQSVSPPPKRPEPANIMIRKSIPQASEFLYKPSNANLNNIIYNHNTNNQIGNQNVEFNYKSHAVSSKDLEDRQRSITSSRKISVIEKDVSDAYRYLDQDKAIHSMFMPRGYNKRIPFIRNIQQRYIAQPQQIELNQTKLKPLKEMNKPPLGQKFDFIKRK